VCVYRWLQVFDLYNAVGQLWDLNCKVFGEDHKNIIFDCIDALLPHSGAAGFQVRAESATMIEAMRMSILTSSSS
jgi:hypothetical protein